MSSREALEEQARLEIEKRKEAEAEAAAALKEKLTKHKTDAPASKDAIDEQARQEIEARKASEANAVLSLKEKIARNKAEAARKKAEKEEAERQAKLEAEIAAKEKAAQLKAAVLQGKRMSQTFKEETKKAQEQAALEKQEREKQLRQNSLALINKVKEEAQRKKEEEQRLAEEEKQKEAEARKEALLEQRRRREEELAKQREEKEQREEEERKRKEEEERKKEEERLEKQKRRMEELQKQKEEQEEAERKKREEAEERQRKLEEETRLAIQKHKEEVQQKREAERDLEEEERQRLEAIRAQEFEEEQAKRKVEMAKMIQDEEERRQAAEKKMKELGLQSSVVNRAGLFSNYGEEPGLEIWVLGDQQVSKIAKKKHGLRGLIGEAHGTFHVERAYIILHTAFSQGRRHFQLHTWIGDECSEEMKKQAEERLNELETGLILEDVQHITHERRGHESENFRAYFEGPIEYVESVTLKKTEGPNFLEKSLYQIKGRNCVRVKRVDAVPESLNSGDVFVLEDGYSIIQWNGKKSNKMERGKALDFGVQRRIERNARVRVQIVDEGNPQCALENNRFWATLRLDRDENGEFIIPGKEKSDDKEAIGATPEGYEMEVKSPEDGGDDLEYEKAYLASLTLYRVAASDPDDRENAQSVEVTKVEVNPERGPDTSMLEEDHCFVLDADTEIFYWVGNGSSEAEREIAKKYAETLHAEPSRQACTIVTKVRQQTETYLFKEKFTGNWGQYTDFDFSESVPGNIAQLVQEEINIDQMHHPEKYAIAREDERLPVPNFDASLDTDFSVYLVTENDKTELDKSEIGLFYSGNCYLVTYTINTGVDRNGNDLTRHIIYYWQGRHSTRDEKALSALLASEIAKHLRLVQVKHVAQNREPEHFLSHFAARTGSMVVQLGRRPSGSGLSIFSTSVATSSQSDESADVQSPGVCLYQLQGESDKSVLAIQCSEAVAESLNSLACFLLLNEDKSNGFIWTGKHSSEVERDAIKSLVEKNKTENTTITIIADGEEPAEFWEYLGGKKEIFTPTNLREENTGKVLFKPKFFTCSNSIGVFRVWEHEEGFSQEELRPRDCCILDGGDRVFVWVGSEANEDCEKMALDTANKYVNYEDESTKKRENCPIHVLKAGEESADFKKYWHTWDTILQQASKDSYASKLASLNKSQQKN